MVTTNPLDVMPTMSADLVRVEGELLASVTSQDPYLTEIAGHLIKAGGKRVRPGFCIAAAATAAGSDGVATADIIKAAVSVELVHLGSLYHDDVMDDAITRRTVESVNARWGNLRAILAGDFLLARASEIAASLGNEVAGLLASTIGRLCEGQVLELQDTYNPSRTEARYLSSIEGKTASLYATACRIGAITAGLSRERIDAATAFGRSYGMAFQIVDDILDVVATDEQLGKPAGHDLIEGVYTLPVLRTMANGNGRGEQLRSLLGGPLTDAQMHEARELVREEGQVDAALAEAGRFVDEAVTALEQLGPSEATDALAGAARHLLVSVSAIAGA